MLLFCDARAIDQTMALKSLALVSEDDVHSFTASSMDDPAVVRDSLRKFIALVTAADHGKTPVVAVEGFGFDQPVPMLVLQKAHGLFPFPSSQGALVRWLDVSVSALSEPTSHADPLTAAKALRDEYLQRINSSAR